MRTCGKARCEEPATTTVAVRYSDRTVVIGDLTPEPNPNFIDLCGRHADALRPPLRWERLDRRVDPLEAVEPAVYPV